VHVGAAVSAFKSTQKMDTLHYLHCVGHDCPNRHNIEPNMHRCEVQCVFIQTALAASSCTINVHRATILISRLFDHQKRTLFNVVGIDLAVPKFDGHYLSYIII
jgi:hypothetical protein